MRFIMNKVFLFILGIILCSISLSIIIFYLNLLTIGYTFLEYVNFITRKIELYSFLCGILCIYLSIRGWISK